MRADADLMVYVAARWPALVRDAVLLGVPPEEAAETVTDALARCRRDWRRASGGEDVDALVGDELRRAAARRPATPPETRARAAEELVVLAPPTVPDLAQRERERSRASRRRAARVALPLLVVAAVAAGYVATRDGSAKPPAPGPHETIERAAATLQENPAPGVVWYADGQLHLAHSVVAVEGLTNMTQLGTGVVYGDDQGRVVHLQSNGVREVLGHTDPAAAVAATAETFWAAWVDPGAGTLVVKQAATGDTVGTADVGPGARVVAVDGNQVYFVDAAGTHVYSPGSDPELRPFLPGELLDVRGRIMAFQGDPATIKVSAMFYSAVHDVPGRGAELSPDGMLVVSRLPGSDDEVGVYDTASGQALADGLAEDDAVLAFAPRDARTIAYVIAEHGLTPGRELQLRTCDLTTTLCRIAARIPNTGGTPVLAR